MKTEFFHYFSSKIKEITNQELFITILIYYRQHFLLILLKSVKIQFFKINFFINSMNHSQQNVTFQKTFTLFLNIILHSDVLNSLQFLLLIFREASAVFLGTNTLFLWLAIQSRGTNLVLRVQCYKIKYPSMSRSCFS